MCGGSGAAYLSKHSLTGGLHPQIVIPFFSLLIKDIYFLNEGCATRLPNGHINFEVSGGRGRRVR